MIQVYKPENTDFEKNGDMTLFPTTAMVHPVLNGEWEAELEHPIDDEGRWKYIVEDAVVKMPSFNGEQLFRVKKKDKSDAGVKAELQPIFMDAKEDCFLVDVRPTDKNGQQALDDMTASNKKYKARSDIQTFSTAYYQTMNLIEAINGENDNSFINRWGGEILFDNFEITVNERVGGDYGAEVRYGKNIQQDGISEEIETRDIVTRIVPKAYNGRMIEGKKPWVDSPLIDKYPTIKYGVMEFEDVKMREDAQEDDEEDGIIICDTEDELKEALKKKCEEQYEMGLDKPAITIQTDMVLLEDTDLYKDFKDLEKVSLGDTVRCRHSKLDIITDARVIEMEWDCIEKKVNNVTLGGFQYNYLDEATSIANRIENAIRPDGSVIGQQVQGIINGVKAQLKAQSSVAKKQNVRAVLFEDLDPDSPTFGAMCLGTMGFQIAASRTSDGRDWDWATFGTGQGFFADFIVAGTMLADRIKGGTLILGGGGNGNGIAKVLDESGNEIVRLDSTGVFAKGKYICDSDTAWDKRIVLAQGSMMFSNKDESDPVFMRYGGNGSLLITRGGTFDDAEGATTLMRIMGDAIYFDTEKVGPGGRAGSSGRAEFSNGTYLEFKNGFLVGGNTMEGAF